MPSASASSRAVSLCALRLIPRSKSLTVRGLTPAASASSSCDRPASTRSCRNSPANATTGGSTATTPSRQNPRQLPPLYKSVGEQPWKKGN